MKTPKLIMVAATMIGLAATGAAHADSTFLFNANQSYLSASDSPFVGAVDSGSMFLEDFESGGISTPGFTINRGHVKGPSNGTDSVDGDNGAIDGFGRSGHSWQSGQFRAIDIRFDADENGNGPNMAGLVWTDGRPNSIVTFRAWDSNGAFLGRVRVTLGDLVRNGTTEEDRFFGVESEDGISRIRISSNRRNFEIDHVQFAYGFSVVPVPAPVALGLVGLAGVALRRRMTRRRAEA